jgi:hypothetical protein
MKSWLLYSALLLACAGCGADEAPPAAARAPVLVEVTSESEEGFHDLVFTIVRKEKTADGGRAIHAAGMHQGTRLGLTVVLGPEWKKGDKGGMPIVTHSGTVTYKSNGPESDAFLKTLDVLYGTKQVPAAMAGETRFAGISLEGNPADLERGEVDIKLFYEADKLYSEHFANIDLKAGKLWIREKDEEYRKPLVQALGRAR